MSNHKTIPGLVLLALLASLLAACGTAPASSEAEQAGASLPLEECQLATPGLNLRVSARCASLPVPEDRAAPQGRMINLHIAVLPALSRTPAPDPLFLLAGGPGQAATEAFVPLLRSLERINQERDIVLVDQRGTGKSNPLRCEVGETSTDSSTEATIAWASSCAQQQQADLTKYTTSIAMDDLNQVRAALGYEQINLLGVSYGTRAAQSYLRQYPTRVRSLILDGVLPQDEALGVAMARDAQRAFDQMVARCNADAVCNENFPSVAQDFSALLARLAQQPLEVSLNDPFTGKPTTVQLTRDLVAATVQTMSYAPEAVALLPLLITTAQRDNDPRPLAAQLQMVSQQLSDSISVGMRLSVVCAEDAPFYPSDGAAADPNSYAGDFYLRQFGAVCAGWPRGETPADFRQPVQSNVPTLLLSGENDPVTPPAYAERVAVGLPNSMQIVAPGQGHNVLYRGCIPRLLDEFLAAGNSSGLDASCVQTLKPTPFFTSFTGPQP